MNTDYRLSVGFFRHHKTRKLQKRLGADGVLALLKLWGYAAEFRSNGDLSDMSSEDLELTIDWMKETPLISALIDIGFVEGEEGRYRLHDWKIHNPWASKDASRSGKARLSRVAKINPELYRTLREQGINEISAADLEKITNSPKEQRFVNDSFENGNDSLTIRSEIATPAPAPAPAPAPDTNTFSKTTKQRAVGENEERSASQAPPRAPKAPSSSSSKAKPVPKAVIAPDWIPADNTYALLQRQGIDRTFIESTIDEFRLYWMEQQVARPGWEATFVNNARRLWERRTTTPPPRNGQRPCFQSAPALSPEAAEFDAILRNLNNPQPVIEGECYVAH